MKIRWDENKRRFVLKKRGIDFAQTNYSIRLTLKIKGPITLNSTVSSVLPEGVW
jgi:uncharacterized DUF497 family protein